MTPRCRDWQSCETTDVVPLVEAEARAWQDELHWNVTESWRVIEPARQVGQLPGLVASDSAGRPTGWTAFLPHEGHLQVMAIAAPDSMTAAVLVDGVLASPHVGDSTSTIICVRSGTPGLVEVLGERGFDVEVYRYLSVDLRSGAVPQASVVRWSHHDEEMARLCARAYDGSRSVRAFATGGTMSEWRSYVASLVQGTGCGWFLPELSFVVAGVDGDLPGGAHELQAAIMMTDLGPGTVHIAQMVVDPDCQGRGVGRQVLHAALAQAAAFYERATLLVASSNTPAIGLYESFGFRQAGEFIVAAKQHRPVDDAVPAAWQPDYASAETRA